MTPPAADNPDPRPPLTPEQRRDRRRLIIAGIIVLGVVGFFYLYAILMFVFRWQIFSDPWKIL